MERNKLAMNSDDIKGCMFVFTLGAGFGMITMSLSAASQGLIGIPLGFAQLNLRNFLKCGLLSGTTFCGIVFINDKVKFLESYEEIFK